MTSPIDQHVARITAQDLAWWLDREADLDWRFATTYAESAPHEYVVAGRTPGFSQQDAARAAHVIRTFGRPMKFYRTTRIYLTTPLGWKHWDMQGAVLDDAEVTLINRGRADHVYGVQNAPRTASGVSTEYDGLATTWDRRAASSVEERTETTRLIADTFGPGLSRTLDVGCGTGWPLDAGLVDATRYVGVDPSTAMLNCLVVKHPTVAAVHPRTLEAALASKVFGGTRFDTVLALGGSASYLSASAVRTLLAERAGRGAVLVHHAPSERPRGLDPHGADEVLAASIELAEAVRHVGRFIVTVIR